MALLRESRGIQDNERERVFEGEAAQALPEEGATRAPIVVDGAKRKIVFPVASCRESIS